MTKLLTALPMALALSLTAGFAASASPAAAEHAPINSQMPEDPQAAALYNQFGFAEAVIDDGRVYVSGIIAGPVPEGMTEEQLYDQTFAHISSILKRAGSSMQDILDITSFHVDLQSSGPAFVASKNRNIPAPFPAWTAIDIDGLYLPGGLIEIKVIARVTPEEE